MKASIFFTLLFITCTIFHLKSQDLSGFELKAHYPLTSNGEDVTGNYEAIELEKPIFSFGGILSRGCYVNNSNFGDSCLIETPEIDAINDYSFAIQVDFSVSTFNRPIIMAGHGYRYLGLQTNSDGNLTLRTNGNQEDDIEDVTLELDTWYQGTIIHYTEDSMTYVYLDGALVYSKKKFVNHPEDDTEISNSNFAWGRAFFGYWKDLKVYSSDSSPNAVENIDEDDLIEIVVSPNPATDILNLDIPDIMGLSYRILDVNGNEVVNSPLHTTSLNIQSIPSGVYLLVLFKDKERAGSAKFIKI